MRSSKTVNRTSNKSAAKSSSAKTRSAISNAVASKGTKKKDASTKAKVVKAKKGKATVNKTPAKKVKVAAKKVPEKKTAAKKAPAKKPVVKAVMKKATMKKATEKKVSEKPKKMASINKAAGNKAAGNKAAGNKAAGNKAAVQKTAAVTEGNSLSSSNQKASEEQSITTMAANPNSAKASTNGSSAADSKGNSDSTVKPAAANSNSAAVNGARVVEKTKISAVNGRVGGSADSGIDGNTNESANGAKNEKHMMEPRVIEDLEFKEGDKVVYPAHGVGVVEAIQLRKISGSEQKFYMVTIVDTGMKIMVPTAQVKTVGLRRVVDTKTVDEVYDILRDRSITVDTQTWNRRYREYSQKIKTGSVLEIARVIRDLSVLKYDKELSFGERRMLDTAQGLLVKELSIAKASTEDLIKAELEQLCAAA